MKSIRFKIFGIINKLVVPKFRYNEKGGFYYRSIEDIYKALKPLLKSSKIIIHFEEGSLGERLSCAMIVTCLTTGESATYRTQMSKVDLSNYDDSVTSYTFAKKSLLTTAFMIDDSGATLSQGEFKSENAPIEKKLSSVSMFYNDVISKINTRCVKEVKNSFDMIPKSKKVDVWNMLSSDHKKLIKSL